MIITPVKTEVITSGSVTLKDLLVSALPPLKEGSIVAITSKVVSLCEGRTVSSSTITKEELIKQESEYYTDPLGSHGFQFTITNNTLIGSGGIDESNAGDNFILWPANPQGTANQIWQQLREHYKIKNLGIVITDSTSLPLRRGTVGISLAYCGFEALRNYVGQPDLFGRPFAVSRANLAEGLAATAVMMMGEGAERTPLCLIEDAEFITFSDKPPTSSQLADIHIQLNEDLFAPLIQSVDWHRGQKAPGE